MHEDSRHEPSHRKTEVLSNSHESWIARNFNYKSYVTCLTGCYSCRWTFQHGKKIEYGSCCCSWKEQVFYVFLVSSCIVSAVVLFLWVETSNEHFSFDWVIYLGTGKWFFWSALLLSVLGIMATYTALLLIVSFLLLWERLELTLHSTHKILVVISILLGTFLMGILCQYWRDKWLIFGLSLKIFAPFVHLSLITMMVIISWPIAIYVCQLESEVRIRRHRMTNYEKENLETCNIFTRIKALQMAAGVSFLLILLCLYVTPLGIYSPCIQEKKNLGPKPVFFGHRGAPMLAPENTMMSFEKAVEYDAFGLETDIYISYDRVPFIMHDYDLSRTTNIREVLPEATYNHSAFFKWSFLSTLNAGKWFLEHKPFINMDPLSEADKKRASNQKIPQLTDVLQLAKKEKKFLIFDLMSSPPRHPYRNTFVRKIIFWLPAFDRSYVRYMAPGFQQVGRLSSIKRLTQENISIINVDYKKLFYNGMRDYKAANIYINLYLINEPWLFSLAWCSRINSVTTDNIKLLSSIDHPHFFMTPTCYIYTWIFMDFVSAIFISVIFYFHWWREINQKRWLQPTRAPPDSQSIRLSKDKTKSKESTRLSAMPPFQIEQSPWSLPTLHSTSTNGGKEHSKTSHSPEDPKENPVPVNTVEPLIPTEVFEHTQAPTRETMETATLQTTQHPLEAAGPEVSSVEDPYAETSQEPSTTDSSKDTYTSTTSSTTSLPLHLAAPETSSK